MNPVFQNIAAGILGISMGNSNIIMWRTGSNAWSGGEVACYTGGVLESAQVMKQGQTMVGSFPCPDGMFTWEMKPDPSGQTFWAMTAGPSGPPQLEQQGLF